MTSLDVYIDFKSPASYLALGPTLALDLPVVWHPFRTQQRPALKLQPDESKSQTHFRIRDEYRRRVWALYADAQGITMNFRDVPGETDAALNVLQEIEGDRTAYVKAAFHAYWVEGADLNDESIVESLTQGTTRTRHDLDAALTSAADIGVVDAPCYVLQEQLFIGREHLPWIRSLLSEL